MCAIHAGKIQSEREYKKEFQKWKTKFSSPVDMLGIVMAKQCQTLVSDIDYRNYLHHWTCLPDQNDIIQAKKAYELQSDVRNTNFGKDGRRGHRFINCPGSAPMGRPHHGQIVIECALHSPRRTPLTLFNT